MRLQQLRESDQVVSKTNPLITLEAVAVAEQGHQLVQWQQGPQCQANKKELSIQQTKFMVGQLRMGLLHQILNIAEVEVAWIQGQAQGVQVVQPFLTK